MLRLLRQAWDRFLLYLPLAVMGVLALGSYWVVRSTPAPSAPSSPTAVRHDPDYFMEDFAIKTFDAQGRLRYEAGGHSVRHYPDTKWLEIDTIRVRSIDANGNLITATADHGLAYEDGSEVKLLGNALLKRAQPEGAQAQGTLDFELKGEFLHVFLNQGRIVSPQPVEISRGRDRLRADRMDIDQDGKVLVLQGRVHGTIEPAH